MEIIKNYQRNDVEIDSDKREVLFVISTDAKDRHGTRLNMDGWNLDNYKRNPIVGYQHNVYGDMCREPNPDDIIGTSDVYLDKVNGKTALMGLVRFEPADLNELADKLYRKVQHGTLSATSVGFREVGKGEYGTGEEARGAENETYYFKGQELLEFSIVNIPSNPEAVKRSIKNHTNSALTYILNALGSTYSLGDIEKMSVADVLRALNGEKIEREIKETLEVVDTKEGFKDQLKLIELKLKSKRLKL